MTFFVSKNPSHMTEVKSFSNLIDKYIYKVNQIQCKHTIDLLHHYHAALHIPVLAKI